MYLFQQNRYKTLKKKQLCLFLKLDILFFTIWLKKCFKRLKQNYNTLILRIFFSGKMKQISLE